MAHDSSSGSEFLNFKYQCIASSLAFNVITALINLKYKCLEFVLPVLVQDGIENTMYQTWNFYIII